MKLLEQFLLPKRGLGEHCGDAVFFGEHFAAVVDGVTPKDTSLFDGLPSDAFIAKAIIDAIGLLPPTATADEAVRFLNERLCDAFRAVGFDLERASLVRRPQASLLIYSAFRGELWSIGDCPFAIDGVSFYMKKEVDKLLSALRCLAYGIISACEQQGEKPPWNGDARGAIMPFLESQPFLSNNHSRFGYGVLNGSDDALEFIEVFPVTKGSHLVLGTDGYPQLFESLEMTEAYLASCLEHDRECLADLEGTKGVEEGNVSFDDRAFLSFIT